MKDIIICSLFIIAIEICRRLWPDSLVAKIILGIFMVCYFGSKLWLWIQKKGAKQK